MTTALALSPHNDDVELFCAFEAMRLRAHVIVVLRSQVQYDRGTGITYVDREAETECAMRELGLTWEQWEFSDADPDWAKIGRRLGLRGADVVLAPAPETGGHEHHNRLGRLAAEAFGPAVAPYLTYTTAGKSTWGRRVDPAAGQVSAKLRALACHRSQADLANCQPHFLRGLDEYLAR